MIEGYSIIDKENVYSWWCSTPGCKEQQYKAFKVIQEAEKKESIALNPQKQLPKYGISQKYLNFTLDNFINQEKFVKLCRGYSEKLQKSLLFTGGCGTGKTHLACAIIREMVIKGKSDLFFKSIPELINELRWSFDNAELNEQDLIGRYSLIHFLVLDDLGAEKNTEYVATSLYSILDKRVRDEKPTIVTTNLSLDEIRDKISIRIASRLSEFKVIKFNMPDYRRKRTCQSQTAK